MLPPEFCLVSTRLGWEEALSASATSPTDWRAWPGPWTPGDIFLVSAPLAGPGCWKLMIS